MRKSLLISAITLALSAPVTAHELTLGYAEGRDYYATYYKAALGIDEDVAVVVHGSTDRAVSAVGVRLDTRKVGIDSELEIITETQWGYTQIEYTVWF